MASSGAALAREPLSEPAQAAHSYGKLASPTLPSLVCAIGNPPRDRAHVRQLVPRPEATFCVPSSLAYRTQYASSLSTQKSWTVLPRIANGRRENRSKGREYVRPLSALKPPYSTFSRSGESCRRDSETWALGNYWVSDRSVLYPILNGIL